MELNIINYILDKEKINQIQLAEMLVPPVSKSILSKWKNGGEVIPKKRVNELMKIAKIGKFTDGQSDKWLKLTDNSSNISDDWYLKFAVHLPYDKVDDVWADFQSQKLNYDSRWIGNIEAMLITLNDAGVPIKELQLDFTFDPTREPIFSEEDNSIIGSVYTPSDELIIQYIETYLAVRIWASWFIASFKHKKLGQLQLEILMRIPEVALYQISKDKYRTIGTNLDVLDKYIEKSKKEVFQLLTKFSILVNTGVDYFKFITEDKEGLRAHYRSLPEYIKKNGARDDDENKIDHFASDTEQRILNGIEKNEELLKEILEKLNKLTDKEE